MEIKMKDELKEDLIAMLRGYLGLVAIWSLHLSPYIKLT